MNHYYYMNNDSLLKKIKIDYMNEENIGVETYDIQEKNQTVTNYLDDILEHPFIDSLESITCLDKATTVNIILYRLNSFNGINYIEYYLLDASGSYLLLDKNANPCWLVVKTEMQMQAFDEVFDYLEDLEDVADTANSIKRREKMPFFLTSNEMKLPPEKWQPYLHSLQRLSGMKNYYYALIKARLPNSFRIKEVLSYQKYLKVL